MGKATSLTSELIAAYSAGKKKKKSQTRINCAPFEEIPAKSPDDSSRVILCFGILKRMGNTLSIYYIEKILENRPRGVEENSHDH